MTSDEFKAKVVRRSQLKALRNEKTGGIDPESTGKNPMALMSKIPDLLEAYRLTQEIEALSDELIGEQIGKVVEVLSDG